MHSPYNSILSISSFNALCASFTCPVSICFSDISIELWKYKNINKILETKDVVLFTSKAGFKIYFEKKNDSVEDIERLHAFFDKQNISWRKSIL